MRQYVINELRPADYEKLKAYFDENFSAGGLGGVYWVPLIDDMLTTVQQDHIECQPHYVALDIEPTLLSCELLVRTRNRMRCDCMGYMSETQRNWLIDCIDSIFEMLEIKS